MPTVWLFHGTVDVYVDIATDSVTMSQCHSVTVSQCLSACVFDDSFDNLETWLQL